MNKTYKRLEEQVPPRIGIDEAAKLINMSSRWLQDNWPMLVSKYGVRVYKIGRCRKFNRDDLLNWVEKYCLVAGEGVS